MKGIFNRLIIKKRERNVAACERYKLDEQQSDQLFGGFKEYKPPIYEQSQDTATKVKINDLFNDFAES
ncbi:hypothetical protein [Olivibacter sp. XZL3]|uniref:hypothetical protein n=1 Tax=Olivibacter sp. XZL3 TaxID=1735116 RepID=UPI00106707B2|nr:hypothetical protein [Olivibacter sp. XZL3]